MKLSTLGKRFPKAYKQLTKTKRVKFETWWHLKDDDVRDHWRLITDFLDSQEIIISIKFETRNNCFLTKIYFHKVKHWYNRHYEVSDSISRKQAETKAICKAFEIVESKY